MTSHEPAAISPAVESRIRNLGRLVGNTPTVRGPAGWPFAGESPWNTPVLPAADRVEPNLIPGCLAKLWFVSQSRDGRCFFACDSDSLIVKAIAGLLCEFYSGHRPAEILAHDPKFLAPLGITQHLTPNRRNALSKVWGHIGQFAQANVETNEAS